MKTYAVNELYTGAELGIVYAKNQKQAERKASNLYAGTLSVKEYSSHLRDLELDQQIKDLRELI